MSSIPSCPKGGWIPELQAAKADSKKHPKRVQAMLRYAEAAAAVRQWNVCKVAAQVGIHLIDESNTADANLKARLKELACQAEKELAVKSHVDEEMFLRHIKPNILENGVNVDTYYVYTGNPCFSNFNLLQYAASRGDIRLMEQAVAMGAALDYPVLPPRIDRNEGFSAPTGATALLMACCQMALAQGLEQNMGLQDADYQRKMNKLNKNTGDCCAQLIMLGADPSVRLCIEGNSNIDQMYRLAGLNGKSAEECGRMSGHQGLIDAMNEMANRENALKLTHCRCGSRLPWKECHAGAGKAESPVYLLHEDKIVCWRYSPLALCPCQNTKKQYYKCCWNSATPTYQNDANAQMVEPQSFLVTEGFAALHETMQQMNLNNGKKIDPRNMSIDDHKKHQQETVNLIHKVGRPFLQNMEGIEWKYKSKMVDWDHDVYAGCIEHQDPGRFFYWNDVHWQIEKPELLLRVEEWNAALEAYCDEKGLQGAERQLIVEKHKASPFAPCANPRCDAYEKEVKEFCKCSRCKRVAYCSRDCQRAHWKKHKRLCFGLCTEKGG